MNKYSATSSLLALATFFTTVPAQSVWAHTAITGANGADATDYSYDGEDGSSVSLNSIAGDNSFALFGGNGGRGVSYGTGGHGGSATLSDTAGLANSATMAFLLEGGDGGQTKGEGSVAGDGGESSLALSLLNTTQSMLEVAGTVTGGDGGKSVYYSPAGFGGAVSANIALNNQKASTVSVNSLVTGGQGGAAAFRDGVSGDGGQASSIVSVTDTAGVVLSATNRAIGGAGGDATSNNGMSSMRYDGPAGQGGAAFASTKIITTAAILPDPRSLTSGSVVAIGGQGGQGLGQGRYNASGNGGSAEAELIADVAGRLSTIADPWSATDPSGTTAPNPTVLAIGGQGGTSEGARESGAGGFATASADIIVRNPWSGTAADPYANATRVDVMAIGGNGGDGIVSLLDGDGGEAQAKAKVTMEGPASTLTGLVVNVTQTGGNSGGGTALTGGIGGSGASSVIQNAIEAHTFGYETLTQTANGGAGGSGYGSGDGGDAASLFDLQDAQARAIVLQTLANAGDAGLGERTNNVGEAGDAQAVTQLLSVVAENLEGYATANGGKGASYNQAGQGGHAFASSSVMGMAFGATVISNASAFGGSGGTNMSGTVVGQSGDAVASAMATGMGTGNTVSSMATAQGKTAQVTTTSTLLDAQGNQLVTKTIGASQGGYITGSSLAVSGLDELKDEMDKSGNVVSFGNVARTSSTAAKLSTLGSANAEMTQLAQGYMAVEHADAAGAETYAMSASYTFSALESGNALLFGFTSSDSRGAGFSSLTFSLTQDGNMLYSNSFASLADWNAFYTSPLYLGAVSGTTSIEVALTEVLLGKGDGFSANYAFVTAPMGTVKGSYTNVAAVPLPGAAPLFLSALVSGGLWARRRRKGA